MNSQYDNLINWVGKHLDCDGYAYNEMPLLLKERFNERVNTIIDTGRNFWYYTDTGYQVSSNGYVTTYTKFSDI